MKQGSLYCQPKQCSMIREIPQNYLRFVLFDSPQMGNIMTPVHPTLQPIVVHCWCVLFILFLFVQPIFASFISFSHPSNLLTEPPAKFSETRVPLTNLGVKIASVNRTNPNVAGEVLLMIGK